MCHQKHWWSGSCRIVSGAHRCPGKLFRGGAIRFAAVLVPDGLAGAPIKIGYAFDVLQRLAMWHYAYPHGIDILAVARMNRPNDTHFAKKCLLGLTERGLDSRSNKNMF